MLPVQGLLLHHLVPLLPVVKVSGRTAATKEQTAAVCHLLLRVYQPLLLLLDCGSVPDE
jgi:transcriptional regulator of aromatic amino acid metabolism